ncbi:hypothetical protein EHI8A_000400 [Entamoeba histolytica HM-1:IMSS-B]|uniref:Uncharacterized protein n=6 Tax=Entamoeba histolytica TaxID=5759 RepID=B1N329_ENTH1|nr:hypothetical protein EHI_118710 [Entamoeba histolytica HM-1:IMSS]EMD48272.1 Hypothetical protein EHI5A_002100 [Entamoeba histolytica KU27]EMH72453.1 hypothetical protein EHI8A_000400 [Entamoeba histolytica HM-1:IMSS-B]EMS15011.1 hypothetical protein KM1_000990 [Entamoeba histolytica HM-3:IMSS]ENY60683.1 hypothetical protein EHI7A_001060 [Entamoeba histolytica HM-1:IMSS-A]GAT93925.1 hypothetical protein CL6EHI_118710 [Entamoeba histolytica]|eukprot:XP_001913595.1 hypothetical protein EHI_118710 [Entamoeba histolytica HM-1:IMSS]
MKAITLLIFCVSLISLVHASYQIHTLQHQVQVTKVSQVIPFFVIGELFGGLVACFVGCCFYGEFVDIKISSGLLKKSRSHFMTFPAFQPLPPTL